MGAEQEQGRTLERDAWRGAGVVTAVEAVKLLITLPQPKTEAEALEYLGVGLFIPMWAIWGEARGWFKEDLSKLANFIANKTR